jgi:hypothetical protein
LRRGKTANVVAAPGTVNPDRVCRQQPLRLGRSGTEADDDSSGTAHCWKRRACSRTIPAGDDRLASFTGERRSARQPRIRRALARKVHVAECAERHGRLDERFAFDNTIRYSNHGIRDISTARQSHSRA